MNVRETVTECRLRNTTRVKENQLGFKPGRSTMEVIILLRRLMLIYRDKKKYLHMMVINLEKELNKGPCKVLWWVMEKKGIHITYK